MRITSEEIATLAGVSRSTVSRVVNNYSNVPEETRQKVMDVIEKYGYEPNSFARALAGKTNQEIVLCISDDSRLWKRWKGMQSPYLMRLIAELISQGKELGYFISVFIISDASDYTRVENMFLNREVFGGIFMGFEYQMEELNKFIVKGFNVAVIDPTLDLLEAENVKEIYSENMEAGYMATNYLLKQGHKHIAYLGGDQRLSSKQREMGYRKALKEAGISDEDMLIVCGNFDVEKTYKVTIELLKDSSITAIYAVSDLFAITAMRAIRDKGLRVPEDIKVVGCDYASEYVELGYHLTSIDLSNHDIVSAALKSVIGIEKRKKIVCKAKLIKGNTA